MTRCPDSTDWVLYAADELPADRREDLDRHLSACETCRRELAEVRRGLAALDALEPAPPLRAEALASLRRRLAAEAERRSAPRRRHHPLRWVGAAAAAAAAAVVALVILQDSDPQPPAWAAYDQVDAEIVEISAGLELLEADTSAFAWDAPETDPPAPADAPPGQSRSGAPPTDTRHG